MDGRKFRICELLVYQYALSLLHSECSADSTSRVVLRLCRQRVIIIIISSSSSSRIPQHIDHLFILLARVRNVKFILRDVCPVNVPLFAFTVDAVTLASVKMLTVVPNDATPAVPRLAQPVSGHFSSGYDDLTVTETYAKTQTVYIV